MSAAAVGKLPPQYVDAERAIIGALLIDNSAADDVFKWLKISAVFYKEEYRVLFEVLKGMFANDEKVDMLTVINKLTTLGKLDVVGGAYEISQLATSVSSAANIDDHCKIVLQHYFKREVIRLGGMLQANGYDEKTDALEILDDAQRLLDSVNSQISRGEEKTWPEILKSITDDVEKLSNLEEGEVGGVPSGLAEVDANVGGWKEAELIILAARPGMGKTAMAVKFISAALRNQLPVAVFQLEMTSVQFGKRLLAVEADNLHANQLYKHGINTDKDWRELNKLVDDTINYPLHIVERSGITVFDLAIEARRLKKKHGIQLLVVDYLQLMSGANKQRNGNREQEISEVSRKLKELAKELKIPVIALSQLSRAVETRGGSKRPMLSDLRESGSIEQDADMVFFLYRPEYYGIDTDEEGQPTDGVCEFIIAKHRNGSMNTVDVGFDDNRVKFMNLVDLREPLPY